MADVVDHPLSDQELGQLGQAPRRERQVVVLRAGQRHLLDLPGAAASVNVGGRPPAYFGCQRVEAVGVEVVDHLPDPVLGGEGDLGDRPARPCPAPTTARSGLFAIGTTDPDAPADDPQQLVALVVGDLPDTHTFGHTQVARPGPSEWWTRPSNVAGHGTSGGRQPQHESYQWPILVVAGLTTEWGFAMLRRSIISLARLCVAATLVVLGATASLEVTSAAPAAAAGSSVGLFAWGYNSDGQLADGTIVGPDLSQRAHAAPCRAWCHSPRASSQLPPPAVLGADSPSARMDIFTPGAPTNQAILVMALAAFSTALRR